MKSPLKRQTHPIPPEHGRFSAIRRYDIHTGVDLYEDVGAPVFAMESGVVVNIEKFTGPSAGSPWWHETKAVLVEGKTGVFLYGEIEPTSNLKIDDKVEEGQILGTILQVLRNDKGLPMSMLHLELYDHGTRESVIWTKEWNKPCNLRNPSFYLKWNREEKKRQPKRKFRGTLHYFRLIQDIESFLEFETENEDFLGLFYFGQDKEQGALASNMEFLREMKILQKETKRKLLSLSVETRKELIQRYPALRSLWDFWEPSPIPKEKSKKQKPKKRRKNRKGSYHDDRICYKISEDGIEW